MSVMSGNSLTRSIGQVIAAGSSPIDVCGVSANMHAGMRPNGLGSNLDWRQSSDDTRQLVGNLRYSDEKLVGNPTLPPTA